MSNLGLLINYYHYFFDIFTYSITTNISFCCVFFSSIILFFSSVLMLLGYNNINIKFDFLCYKTCVLSGPVTLSCGFLMIG